MPTCHACVRRAEFGSGPGPNVGILCEYDALPGIGHACGHNLIAEVGVAAAIGVKAAMQKSDKINGKVRTDTRHSPSKNSL